MKTTYTLIDDTNGIIYTKQTNNPQSWIEEMLEVNYGLEVVEWATNFFVDCWEVAELVKVEDSRITGRRTGEIYPDENSDTCFHIELNDPFPPFWAPEDLF